MADTEGWNLDELDPERAGLVVSTDFPITFLGFLRARHHSIEAQREVKDDHDGDFVDFLRREHAERQAGILAMIEGEPEG